MPLESGLLSLEKFLPTCFLCIGGIQDFVPKRLLRRLDVDSGGVCSSPVLRKNHPPMSMAAPHRRKPISQ